MCWNRLRPRGNQPFFAAETDFGAATLSQQQETEIRQLERERRMGCVPIPPG